MHNDGANNGDLTAARDRQGRFVCFRGPGRPRGSRNRNARFRTALYDCLERSPDGFDELVRRIMDEHPLELLKLFVRLLPRERCVDGPEPRQVVLNFRMAGDGDDRLDQATNRRGD